MVSEFEKKVRELDNKNEKIYTVSKKIAKKSNMAFESIRIIIQAKRRGFSSVISYHDYLSRKKGFKNFSEYKDFRAQTHGFLNRAEYVSYYRYRKKGTFRSLRDFKEREGLNEHIEYLDPSIFDSFPSSRDYSVFSDILEKENERQNTFAILKGIINKLPHRYRLIIKKIFYGEKNLREIGEELNISRERVRQMQNEALKRLYPLAKASGLYDFYILDKSQNPSGF